MLGKTSKQSVRDLLRVSLLGIMNLFCILENEADRPRARQGQGRAGHSRANQEPTRQGDVFRNQRRNYGTCPVSLRSGLISVVHVG